MASDWLAAVLPANEMSGYENPCKCGVVSLTFRELSKIISRKYKMREITFMVSISSRYFVRVPRAWLWAHAQSFGLTFSSEVQFLQNTNFERIFWRARGRRSAPAVDIPRDVCLTASHNHKVFLSSSTYIKYVESKMIALIVLRNEKYSDLMANYLSILVWRRLPSELTSPVKWSSRAEGPTFRSIFQGLHLAHKKPEYEYGFIP